MMRQPVGGLGRLECVRLLRERRDDDVIDVSGAGAPDEHAAVEDVGRLAE